MMTAPSFDDLDELERIVRESGWASATPLALNVEERRVADKLLGKADAKRLSRLKTGERFKYRPVRTIRVEFYLGDGWTIEGVETTGRRVVATALPREKLVDQIATLRGRGYDCRFIVTEPMRAWGVTSEPTVEVEQTAKKRAEGVSYSGRPIAQSRHQPSASRQLLEELRGFKR